MFGLHFGPRKDEDEQLENPLLTEEEFVIEDEDWDIGEKGGAVGKDDEDWDSPDYMRQFLDNGFGDVPPKGYSPDADDST